MLKDNAGMIGQTGTITANRGELRFSVKVLDVRSAFGRVDYLVKPIRGSGQAWIQADTFAPDAPAPQQPTSGD